VVTTDHFNFETTDAPLRADLATAFRDVWAHIATPGPGWSSAERVAIGDEARRAETCALCLARKKAVSPNAVQGEHDHGTVLPEAAIEAIHRMSTDSGRLTKSFSEQTLAAGISDSQWVEFVGIVSSLKSIDTFCRAAGLPIEPLPEPSDAPATGYRPEGATISGGWVPMILEKDLAEPEKMLYGGVSRTGNVLRAMSLVPDEVRNLRSISTAMYLADKDVINFRAAGDRAIDRVQMEFLASRVSAMNECFY
jgi:hypothetical protein